jgi:hypothetical protein
MLIVSGRTGKPPGSCRYDPDNRYPGHRRTRTTAVFAGGAAILTVCVRKLPTKVLIFCAWVKVCHTIAGIDFDLCLIRYRERNSSSRRNSAPIAN